MSLKQATWRAGVAAFTASMAAQQRLKKRTWALAPLILEWAILNLKNVTPGCNCIDTAPDVCRKLLLLTAGEICTALTLKRSPQHSRLQLRHAQKRDYLKALTKELRERIMTHLTRDDLFSDPVSKTDASGEIKWAFQVNSGFFSPSEGQFSYEGEVYFVKEVDRNTSTRDMWVLTCIKI